MKRQQLIDPNLNRNRLKARCEAEARLKKCMVESNYDFELRVQDEMTQGKLKELVVQSL